MRSNGEGSSPSQPHNAVLLGKKLSSRSASLHPEALNGTGEPSQKLALEMTKMDIHGDDELVPPSQPICCQT